MSVRGVPSLAAAHTLSSLELCVTTGMSNSLQRGARAATARSLETLKPLLLDVTPVVAVADAAFENAVGAASAAEVVEDEDEDDVDEEEEEAGDGEDVDAILAASNVLLDSLYRACLSEYSALIAAESTHSSQIARVVTSFSSRFNNWTGQQREAKYNRSSLGQLSLLISRSPARSSMAF